MTIDQEIISFAEKKLLPEGIHFDKERTDFIKRIDSLDLLAVPGSGKTTALLAKLICMSKQLPLTNGTGILVLSHTNTAIEEIKQKIMEHVPALFRYPNDVCTVQEFVDKYLAIPFYKTIFGRTISAIDANSYCDRIEKYLNKPSYGEIYYFKQQIKESFHKIRFDVDDNGKVYLAENMSGKPYSFEAPKKWITEGTAEAKKRNIIDYIYKTKKAVMNDGILHFDDCYFLANYAIKHNPKIISTLRNRFQYVFIDETQDLEKYQLDILDKLFNDKSVSFQRIGDPNQAIYNGKAADCTWHPRNSITLNKSLRLSKEIADVVDKLCLDRYNTENGLPLFVVKSDTERQIKPHLILYDSMTVGQLSNIFKSLIIKYKLNDTPEGRKYGYHIIGWNAEAKNEGYNKYHLEDIFPDYSKKATASLSSLSNANDYIFVMKRCSVTKQAYSLVQELICHALRIVDIHFAEQGNNRYYTPNSLNTYLQSTKNGAYDKYKMVVFNAVKMRDECDIVNNMLKKYIKEDLLPLFNIQSNNNLDHFFESESTISHIVPEEKKQPNNGDIIIGTIHSVKGMTHCATMYVETWYERHYECEHVKSGSKSPLFKDEHKLKGVYSRQAIKMMYVGCSRPTHLLCYASQSHLWSKEERNKMEEAGWEICDISQKRILSENMSSITF